MWSGSCSASAFSRRSISRSFTLPASYASSSANSLSVVRSCDFRKTEQPVIALGLDMYSHQRPTGSPAPPNRTSVRPQPTGTSSGSRRRIDTRRRELHAEPKHFLGKPTLVEAGAEVDITFDHGPVAPRDGTAQDRGRRGGDASGGLQRAGAFPATRQGAAWRGQSSRLKPSLSARSGSGTPAASPESSRTSTWMRASPWPDPPRPCAPSRSATPNRYSILPSAAKASLSRSKNRSPSDGSGSGASPLVGLVADADGNGGCCHLGTPRGTAHPEPGEAAGAK